MRFPRLPDWLIYVAAVGALLFVAPSREGQGALIGPASPFDPSVSVDVPEHPGPAAGTAFSVASSGLWITARHVVDGCRQAALVVGEGRGVAANAQIDPRGEAALLR